MGPLGSPQLLTHPWWLQAPKPGSWEEIGMGMNKPCTQLPRRQNGLGELTCLLGQPEDEQTGWQIRAKQTDKRQSQPGTVLGSISWPTGRICFLALADDFPCLKSFSCFPSEDTLLVRCMCEENKRLKVDTGPVMLTVVCSGWVGSKVFSSFPSLLMCVE